MEKCLPETMKSMAERGIPVAQLSIISLAKLNANDPAEVALLKKAASNTGLFYLDLRGDAGGERVLSHLPDIYALTETYFTQPEETKLRDSRLDIKASQDLGWKKGSGGESFEIARDELNSLTFPSIFQEYRRDITEFSAGCDEACLTILQSLSTDFAVHHRANQPSDTGLKFVLHPSSARLSEVCETLHTDSGTLTLLFYEDWSIHAFLPDANMWAFTPPLENCALINIGDSLQRLSGGKLHSPKHRVTQPFDGAKNRYYLSYFLRPETALVEKWDAAR